MVSMKVKQMLKLMENPKTREMISHLHEFTYIRNPDRRMTI